MSTITEIGERTNTGKPLVSVIIPVYDVELYLHKCVDSVLKQTFLNSEIILVDDGSNDNCPKICDQYSLLDERIRVIHQNHLGLSAARNKGIEMSKGDFLVFVDSDDWIDDSMI